MSRKPMELNVYPTWNDGYGRIYADMDDPTRPIDADFMAFVKRLKDSELAAEYYHARFDQAIVAIGPRSIMRQRHISNTLHRFATLPHYDEVTP